MASSSSTSWRGPQPWRPRRRAPWRRPRGPRGRGRGERGEIERHSLVVVLSANRCGQSANQLELRVGGSGGARGAAGGAAVTPLAAKIARAARAGPVQRDAKHVVRRAIRRAPHLEAQRGERSFALRARADYWLGRLAISIELCSAPPPGCVQTPPVLLSPPGRVGRAPMTKPRSNPDDLAHSSTASGPIDSASPSSLHFTRCANTRTPARRASPRYRANEGHASAFGRNLVASLRTTTKRTAAVHVLRLYENASGAPSVRIQPAMIDLHPSSSWERGIMSTLNHSTVATVSGTSSSAHS